MLLRFAPPLTTRSTDWISQALALQQRKGSQLQILIVPTTEPEAIEQYTLRVFDQWKLGRKGADDGDCDGLSRFR